MHRPTQEANTGINNRTVAGASSSAASSDNILDFTIQQFGPSTDEDLYEEVRTATAAQLEEFLDAYAKFAVNEMTRAPILKPGELRPYFPAGDMPAWMQGRFTIDNHALTADGGDWKAASAIKHRLLYCHSVAFDDPMPEVASLAMAQLRIPQPIHNGLLNYVSLLLHFKDLIREHVVCPVSHESYLEGHISPDYIALGEKIRASIEESKLLPDIDELLEAAPADVQADWRAALKHKSEGTVVKEANMLKAAERIANALAGVRNAKGRLSLYFPFRYDVRLLQRWGGLDLPNDVHDLDTRLLNELVDLEMPNLEHLEPSEILAVRNGDEFEQWRRSLKAALIEAGRLPSDLLNRRDEIRKVVDEQLIDGKARLQSAIEKSPLLSAASKGAVTLVAGVASALVVHYLTHNTLDTFVAAIVGSGAAGLVQSAAAAMSTPTATEAQRAALVHYVAVLR